MDKSPLFSLPYHTLIYFFKQIRRVMNITKKSKAFALSKLDVYQEKKPHFLFVKSFWLHPKEGVPIQT